MKGSKYRNTAFLIELLINVLVLSISCAVLVQVFVHAALMVQQTNRSNAAGNEIYSLLQTAKAEGVNTLEADEVQDGVLLFGYDSTWQRTGLDGSRYIVRMEITPETRGAGSLYHVTATAETAKGEELCDFTSAVYEPEGGAL